MLLRSVLQLFFTLSSGSLAAITNNHQQPLFNDDSASSSSLPSTASAPSYRSDLIALHKHLVEIPSTSGREHDAGVFLVDYFASQKWHYELQSVSPRAATPSDKPRFNVVAWPPSSSSSSSPNNAAAPSPKVLVTSHIDCVPPHIPYSISSQDPTSSTVIAGRCSVDAKGSVAAQLTAVQSLLSTGALAPEDVMVLYVVGEEVSGDGMKVFSALNATQLAPSLKAAVFGEPTENKLACGHKGGLRCDIIAKGKAAHSGYPWLGKSATEVLSRAVVKMLDTELGSSERYGNTTINVGTLEGGVAGNVVPAHAKAELMGRVAVEPHETGHEKVIAKIEDILREVDGEALSLECLGGLGPTRCDCDVDGFDTFVANYATDVPYLAGNHARYLYGPGTIHVAHGDDEALTVGDLEAAVEGFKKLILHSLEL